MAVPAKAANSGTGRAAGRRRQASKGDRTEEAILETLERLLAARPLSAVTIEELASGAGISRPTFYFYFDSREAALLAIAERLSDQLFEAGDSWMRRTDESPETAIGRAVANTLGLWREHGAVLRAALEARVVDARMRDFAGGVGERFVSATAAQIERERAAGLAPPEPPSARALANLLVAMNERTCYDVSPRLGQDAEADQRVIDTLTTVWLRAIYGTVEAG